MSDRRSLHRLLLPLVMLALLPTAARADEPINVTPHGGPVLENVHVTPIFWGGWWNTDPEGAVLRSYLEGFFRDLFADGRFMKNLDEQYSLPGHSIGNGTLDRGLVLDRPGVEDEPPPIVTGDDVYTELIGLVNNGLLPPPSLSRLYIFFLPPGTVDDQGGIAYHDSSEHLDYVYAVCFYHNPALMTSNVSHELAQAVTDPIRFDREFAWFDTSLGPDCGEIADVVENLWADGKLPNGNDDLWDALGYQGRYYLVQKVWCQKSQRIAAFP